jgi:VIT1/CCC1 family predicted Fe2+/Mn2+ transporter
MAGHDIRFVDRQLSFNDMQIGSAYSTSANTNQDLVRTRLRFRHFHPFERCGSNGRGGFQGRRHACIKSRNRAAKICPRAAGPYDPNMPSSEPDEKDAHFTGNAVLRDIIIGMSDGLTVPFALAAGLSAAVSTSFVVLVAGVAELAAGSISMGLGGYLAGRNDRDHYFAETARERRHIRKTPEAERTEVREILSSYGLGGQTLNRAVDEITANPHGWVDFMMRNELSLARPDPKRALKSALTIGASYIAGGILPLLPYALGLRVGEALAWSAGLTLIALLVFGAVKGRVTDSSVPRGALETALIGSLAAGAAYLLARLVSQFGQ